MATNHLSLESPLQSNAAFFWRMLRALFALVVAFSMSFALVLKSQEGTNPLSRVDTILAYVLSAGLGLIGISTLMEFAKSPRWSRVRLVTDGICMVVFGAFFLGLMLKDQFVPTPELDMVGPRPVFRASATGIVVLVSVPLMVVAFLLMGRAATKADDAELDHWRPWPVLVWPVMILTRGDLARAVGLEGLGVLGLFAGEYLGGRAGHPILGTSIAAILLLVIPTAVAMARWTLQQRRKAALPG